MNFSIATEFFVNLCSFFNIIRDTCRVARLLVCVTIIAAVLPTVVLGATEQDDVPAHVGEVSLVLGKAYVGRTDRERRLVEAGSPIRVNDQIITGANGHVHVRFIDDALVSVRPNSQLEVVRYEYNPDRPDQSAVKFNLSEGVARTISGAAAKAARERFRLNTPIAAIGVRGTDFVVSATPDTVRASVNEGVIVMAPFSAECSSESLGPCEQNAVELSVESMQVIELNAGQTAGALATMERDSALLQERTASPEAPSETPSNAGESESEADEKLVSTDVFLESVTSNQVTAEAKVVADAENDVPAVVDEVEPDDPLPVTSVDFTPAEPLANNVLTQRQLVWGRWAWSGGQGAQERITLGSSELPGGYTVTVSNLDYGLYRREGSRGARVDSGLGIVGFALNSAQAFYNSDSGIVAMRVTDGTLNIDFDRKTFSTALALEHASTGLIDFSALGEIVSGGYFYSRSDGQDLSGAVSIDGSEAGYSFEKQLDSGTVSGLTLWDSK